jgi:hypothetical protein
MGEFDRLADRLYGKNGVYAGDIKIFHGLTKSSPDGIAAEINKFFDEFESGSVEVVHGDETPEKGGY